MMKINKIREMSSPDLEKEDNPMRIKEVKRDIAKINTVLTERKIAEAKA